LFHKVADNKPKDYSISDDVTISPLNLDKTAIIERLDAIEMCINNICNTEYTLQDCDVSFINKQICCIKNAIK